MGFSPYLQPLKFCYFTVFAASAKSEMLLVTGLATSGHALMLRFTVFAASANAEMLQFSTVFAAEPGTKAQPHLCKETWPSHTFAKEAFPPANNLLFLTVVDVASQAVQDKKPKPLRP